MTLPVSSYEELLTRVRSLTQETRQLQQQLDSPLPDQHSTNENMISNREGGNGVSQNIISPGIERSLTMYASEPPHLPDPTVLDNGSAGSGMLVRLLSWPNKEEITSPEAKEQDEKISTPVKPIAEDKTHKWASTEFNIWHSVGPTTEKISSGEISMGPRSYSQHQLGAKVEMVYSLLSMLGTQDRDEMTRTLLVLSSSPESCLALRQSGCMPLLVQLVHGGHESKAVRNCAAQALHNLVHCHTDDKRGRREARVLRLIEQIQEYCANITPLQEDSSPCVAIAALMKLSFDEEHRHTMCQLGALQAIATLIQVDNEAHGSDTNDSQSIILRRYAGMALTNLTFGDCNNKAMLCSMKRFLTALVAQLQSPSEDLRQVTASVLRNLSWRADTHSKQALRQVGACTALMVTAMEVKKESTMKSILSALWNLTAHCNLNKADICAVKGALQYLVEMLRFLDAPSKTLAVVENAGGILRNISSHIAVREDYREMLRKHNCIPLLLQQLKSASLTVVSNACGTLWNLSARSVVDQGTLWQLGAVPMLRSLVHSKHKMISMGSSAALKNLLAAHPDADKLERSSKGAPTLLVRKKRALEQELDSTLDETCDNIESMERWNSCESVISSQSDQPKAITKDSEHSDSPQLTILPAKETEENLSPDNLMENLSLQESIDYDSKYRDDETPIVSEQPVNYSLKYPDEEKLESDRRDQVIENFSETDVDQPTDFSLKYNEHEPSPEFFHDRNIQHNSEQPACSVYTETDLDQPTNYSLRYTEEEPEKPQLYCTEGTPYNFSNATSLSDLRSSETNKKPLEGKRGVHTPEHVSKPNMTKEDLREGKVVMLETPLMFSRCSSLGSLSSCEPPDDRSSVVSEVSVGGTSGMVSPSELPDSPTQTVPPPSLSTKDPLKPTSVFEERVSLFKEECTPVQFSTATSLSDLTFDDEQPVESGSKFEPPVEVYSLNETEGEDMLAACINIGMQQNNRRSMAKDLPTICGGPTEQTKCSSISAKASKPLPSQSEVLDDSTTVFRTEDTPANVSHATSRSDLSNLCVLSDDSDHDNILAECIQSGMPQARLMTSTNPKRPIKVATVFPMPIQPPPISKNELQCPPSKFIHTSPIKTDATQDPYKHCPVEQNQNLDRCRQVSPIPDDGNSPLSSLEPDVEEAVTVLSRQLSVGSISGDWIEAQDEELLEQCISSGMPKTKSAESQSGTCDLMRESDTWNDDTSPSLPSISMTAPLVNSYKSLEEDPIKPEPTIIELDAGKVGLISNLELDNSISQLEAMRPPSCMSSLLSLTTGVTGVTRRAGTCSSLSWHNLDSVKPPSGMDEVMELENSILSCASLTSEVADSPASSIIDDTLIPTPRLTPKIKRQTLKNRYNTYTITDDKSSRDSSLDTDNYLDSEILVEQSDPSSPVKQQRLTPKGKRENNKERFCTRTIPAPLSPRDKRLTNKDRYKTRIIHGPVIITSPEQSHRLERTVKEMSDSEAVAASQHSKIDNEKDLKFEEIKNHDDKNETFIVKPTETESVRGRKPARSHIPIVSRSQASRSPKLMSSLQRQGTFTKDELQTTPVTSGIPVFSTVKKETAIKMNVNKKISNISAETSSTIQVKASLGRGRAGSLPRSEPPQKVSGVRSSKSNQNLKSVALGSNTSLSSGNSGHSTPGAKKEATSKIISLWKKVDDCKMKKEAEGKNKRIWISPVSSQPKNKQVV